MADAPCPCRVSCSPQEDPEEPGDTRSHRIRYCPLHAAAEATARRLAEVEAALLRFGAHRGHCPPLGPCACGFGAALAMAEKRRY